MQRRSFVPLSIGALLAPRSARAAVAPAAFREKMIGPVCSVPTVYNSDYSIDYAAIRRIVDCGLKAGSPVFALTAGNSQYDRLTYTEIRELTSGLVKAVNGRGMVIAATGQWWTGQCVDYAKHAEAAGADALQVFLPAFGNDETVYAHFTAIAKATRLGIVLHGQVPLPLLKRLVGIESVVAYKEEYPPMYSAEVYSLYRDRLNIFGGGQKSRYLMFRDLGMKAYYSTFSTFAPEVPRRFWSACGKGDLSAARDVMNRQDIPFFARFSHGFWRATMAHFGTAQRYLRPPEPYWTETQVGGLKEFYKTLGV
ncbi:MAG: dihydrodipicolinate synthase family protein [Bryobacterales bacterium]|nr:dihydrodipicolinate synthase family protein [Bryobacterales bacterium]